MLKNASEEYVAATIIHELVYTILYYKRIPGDLQHQEMIANQLADMEATMLELFPKMDKYDAHALCYEGLDETIYGGALKKIFPQIWNGMVKINKAHREGTKGTKCK
ncbi:hypothetical protein [Chitinophaga polysaccharea]|uniref:hypothetical protein n=1 Tax=Chitinophaga polysaccharea TaxID=1293035 RepID=UPI001159CCB1|nr:hypothetical protein [Chitinophaga polysaccharea]